MKDDKITKINNDKRKTQVKYEMKYEFILRQK